MRVAVDSDACCGHGICLALCPEVFVMTDAGYAQVQVDDVPAGCEVPVDEAVACCPEGAISYPDPSDDPA